MHMNSCRFVRGIAQQSNSERLKSEYGFFSSTHFFSFSASMKLHFIASDKFKFVKEKNSENFVITFCFSSLFPPRNENPPLIRTKNGDEFSVPATHKKMQSSLTKICLLFNVAFFRFEEDLMLIPRTSRKSNLVVDIFSGFWQLIHECLPRIAFSISVSYLGRKEEKISRSFFFALRDVRA